MCRDIRQVLLAFIFLFNRGVGADIKFEITPKTFTPLLTDDVTFRCSYNDQMTPNTIPGTPATSGTITNPFSIFITKNGADVATVSQQSPARYFGNSSHMEVTGDVSGNSGFLQLVFHYPSDQQSGSYRCHVAGFDQRGHPHDVSTTDDVASDTNVTFAALIDEIHELKKEKEQLNNMMELLHNLTQSQDKTNKDLMRRMDAMEQRVNRVNKHVYFSAGATSDETLSPNSRIIFDKVFTSIGGGYDHTTGTFTCPESGDYLFLIHVADQPDKMATVYLMLNGHSVVSMIADDHLDWQAASNSVVISLAMGDTVHVQSADGQSANVHGYYAPPSTITGILLSSA